ncbi:PAS domain S-box protein [Vibrio hippocampi]|uniref:PAS domain-containing protein n=1 Tax=Vibrio hippocampi TaxID=654686 RepID=A0ABN8DH28_9VIBR|nr:PAS domain S-box protein [Vibrio hippocampi]CAH0526077.1 hypothetical protein VHP8226_01564 [Vibrio hippocampi]
MKSVVKHVPLNAALLLLSGGIFYVDLTIPLGVAAGVPYVTVILVSLISQRQSTILIWATACTLLTLFGYYLSPIGSETWKVVTNRILAIYAIWAVAIVSIVVKERARTLSKLEQNLKLSESRATLGLVAEYTKDAIVITDKQGLITWVNQGFISLSGYQLDEVLGSKPSSLLQGKKRIFQR